MKNQFVKLVALLFLSSLFFVACSDDDDENPATPALEKANVKVVHASPDAPAVDVLVDGAPLVSGADYKDGAWCRSISR